MGFAIKTPKIQQTSAAATYTPPPVVAETVQDDATRAYDQKRSNKRGLLSTILNTRMKGGSLTPQSTGNSTLG